MPQAWTEPNKIQPSTQIQTNIHVPQLQLYSPKNSPVEQTSNYWIGLMHFTPTTWSPTIKGAMQAIGTCNWSTCQPPTDNTISQAETLLFHFQITRQPTILKPEPVNLGPLRSQPTSTSAHVDLGQRINIEMVAHNIMSIGWDRRGPRSTWVSSIYMYVDFGPYCIKVFILNNIYISILCIYRYVIIILYI